jgi:hypothetical protein
MKAKWLSRGAVAVVTLCICTTAAAQEVPVSWTRYKGGTGVTSRETRCAMSTRTAWMVTTEAGRAVERLADVWQTDRRDDTPYPITYSPAMLGPWPRADAAPDYEHWATTFAAVDARRSVLWVNDGWFIGFDGGEFGGSLWWFPAQPGQGTKVLDGNVAFLVRHSRHSTVAALQGLAHLDADVGRVVSLERSSDGRWLPASSRDLGASPSAFSVTPAGDVLAWTATEGARRRKARTTRAVALMELLTRRTGPPRV